MTNAPHDLAMPGPCKASVAAEALAAALGLDNEWWQGRALGRLAPLLSGDQFARAFAAARRMRSARARIQCLLYLCYHIAPDEQAAVAEEALASLPDGGDDQQRPRIVCQIAPRLSPGRRQAVALATLPAVASIPDETQRVWALWTLAGVLPESGRLEAVSIARAIEDPGARSLALAALSTHLPKPQEDAVLAEAAALARGVADPEARAFSLVSLMGRLPAEERAAVAEEALASAEASHDSLLWARVLDGVGAHLSSAALDAATGQAESLPGSEARTLALAALGACLPADRRESIVVQALAGAAGLDDWNQADLLRRLAERLSATTLPPALAVARALADPWARADALARLARLLPAEHGQQMAVVLEGLEAARVCANGWMRAQALAAVCEQWPPANQAP